MVLDPTKNFAIVELTGGFASGVTVVTLTSGGGAKLPDPATDGAFNLVWWNDTDFKNPANDTDVEIVRCTARTGDTLTITRAQEGTADTNKNVGGKTYRMILAPTKKLIDDLDEFGVRITQNEKNTFNLFLENFFQSKITPVSGLFFDGFSDSTKVDTLSVVTVNTTDKKLEIPIPEEVGDGSDGALTSTGIDKVDTVKKGVTSAAASGQKDVIVSDGSVFTVGKSVLIHQTQFTNAGDHEFAKIASIATNTLTMESNLTNSYGSTGAQVLQIKQFTTVTVNSGGDVTADDWDGTVGGIICFFCQGTVQVNTGGKINGQGIGFNGGGDSGVIGIQGDSELGVGGDSRSPNGSAGGGGKAVFPGFQTGGGGGAGNVVAGQNGSGSPGIPGQGGNAIGVADLATIFLGAGGGGGTGSGGNVGGRGGGIIIFIALDLDMNGGTITARGDNGFFFGSNHRGGGGGAAGSIKLFIGLSVALATDKVAALKGIGGANPSSQQGGNGSDGRIAINLDSGAKTGTTDPVHNDDGVLAGFLGANSATSGFYESILTAFQQSKDTVTLWIIRSFDKQFNLAAGISAGATTLTITGDQTATFANGDTVDISTSTNQIRERKTLTAVPSFAAGVTTLTFSATTNAFTTSDFVERVDVLPTISLVDSGTAKSFVAPTFVQSIVDFTNSEVEDEYSLTIAPAEEDLKVKITIDRNGTASLPFAKRLGVALS